MHTRLIAILFLTLISIRSLGQKEAAIWTFGDLAGIEFSSSTVGPYIGTDMIQQEGCATMCDGATGNLLLYTDGRTVWDRNHNYMPNGTGLLGNLSASQSGVIVPKPGSSTNYYVFTVDAAAGVNGMRYSEVDLTLNSGNGDVLTANKNTLLRTPVTEKLTAVQHSNGTDIWVMTHDWLSRDFLAYLVTAAGVNPTPVVSTVGMMHSGSSANTIGYLRFSPNGQQIAIASRDSGGVVEILDFDATTGVVANPKRLALQGVYGLEFSPNNRLLYAMGSTPHVIVQFDLSSGVAATMQASKVQLASSTQWYGALQLGPDKRVYIARYTEDSLAVIDQPNVVGVGCNYMHNGVRIGGTECRIGLPNYVTSFFSSKQIVVTPFCLGDSTYAWLTDTTEVDSVVWDFDDPNDPGFQRGKSPVHYYTKPGTHTITAIVWHDGNTDTLMKIVQASPTPSVDLGPDRLACEGSIFTLDSKFADGYVEWSTGDTTQKLTLLAPGTFWVEATVAGCSTIDTIELFWQPNPIADAGPDLLSECIAEHLQAKASDHASFTWNPTDGLADPNSLTSMADPEETTTYTLTVTDSVGCTSTDEVEVISDLQSGLEMPNAFTPNNDGVNDVIAPVNGCIFEGRYQVINRYGRVVFESNDLDIPWDGTFKGQPQPSGTYVFYLTGKTESDEPVEMKGNITLLR
jgi:gliding motility-associated-like protein